jgi:SPP1 gp7 family putative phage head morphogenesis protein
VADEWASKIVSAPSLEAALRIVEHWSPSKSLDIAWEKALYESAFQADMLGRLELVGPEAGIVALAAAPRTLYQFLSLPFKEAVAFFRKKRVMTPEAFYKLEAKYRARAFTAKKLRNQYLRTKAKKAIERAIKKGTTLQQFKKDIDKLTDALGHSRTSRHYLKTVWDTNVQTSYNAGHYQQARQPLLMKARPYWQYQTVGDRRVRPEHAAMHGRVWAADDPIWGRLYPPNGFACRCWTVTLSEDEARAEGVEVEPRDTLPKGGKIDKGFEAAPTAVLD